MIATGCAADRNCCAAFSYELRGSAAAQLRGNIGLRVKKRRKLGTGLATRRDKMLQPLEGTSVSH